MVRSLQIDSLRILIAAVLLAVLAAPAWSAEPLKVSVVERKPFVVKSDDQFTGFSIELWDAVAAKLGRSYQVQTHESFSEMLRSVSSKEADLAVANISITASRETEMDFAQPIFDAGLQILVPTDGSGKLSGFLGAVLNWRMLILVLAAVAVVFVIGNLMWFFERNKSPYFQRSYKEGMWPSFWWAMHALISGGFEEHVPRSIPGRILGTTLLLSTLFLVSAFVATLTSAMTVSELKSGISDVQDLYGKRVGTTGGSTAAQFLQARGVKATEFDDINALFDALKGRQLDAVVHDAPVLAYYANTDGRGSVQLAGRIFQPQKYGIALPEGSPLTEPINRALLQIRENGSYENIYTKWFGEQR
jgi:polar amino acid transport system substrate-binding protein